MQLTRIRLTDWIKRAYNRIEGPAANGTFLGDGNRLIDSVLFDQQSKIKTVQPFAEFEWTPRESTTYLSKMQQGGEELMGLLQANTALRSQAMSASMNKHRKLPHVQLLNAALIEPGDSAREARAGHLVEAIMREVPGLDRSLWVLDTVITPAPLLGGLDPFPRTL